MKTKKILYFFVILGSVCLFSKISAKTPKTHKIISNPDIKQTTEMQNVQTTNFLSRKSFDNYSIRSFFNFLNQHNQTNYKNIINSKSHIFNKSMTQYIKKQYNATNYSDFLSQNGTPIVEFLELCNELNIDTETTYGGLRLFYTKMKSCEVVDDTVVNQLLKYCPGLFVRYFEPQKEKQSLSFLKKNIEKILLTKFTEHLTGFLDTPDLFLSQLARDIKNLTKVELNKKIEKLNQKESKDRFRNLIIKFFEMILNKTMWDYRRYEGIWQSVLDTAHGFQVLGSHNIIDHMDDLDDLLWSLTHRFCFFLDFAGPSLPIAFYDEIESDLENKVAFFLEEPEQDEGIKTKKETLIEALTKSKAKALAAERGILADSTIAV